MKFENPLAKEDKARAQNICEDILGGCWCDVAKENFIIKEIE